MNACPRPPTVPALEKLTVTASLAEMRARLPELMLRDQRQLAGRVGRAAS
jgi:hypothetical protein